MKVPRETLWCPLILMREGLLRTCRLAPNFPVFWDIRVANPIIGLLYFLAAAPFPPIDWFIYNGLFPSPPDHRLYLCLPRPRLALDGGCYLYRPVPSLDFSMMNFYCALHRACAKPQCGVLGPTLRNLKPMKSPRPHKLHTALIELLVALSSLSYRASFRRRRDSNPHLLFVRSII